MSGPLAFAPWPDLPTVRRVATNELEGWVRTLHAQAPTALGLWIEEQASHSGPELWVSMRKNAEQREIYCLHSEAWEQLRIFFNYLHRDDAPFVVLGEGQAQLHLLATQGLSLRRIGCLRSAAALLARAKGESAPGQLQELVQRSFSRSLPQGGAAQVDSLIPLMRRYAPELRKQGLMPSFELECKLLPAVVAMERAGMPLDAAAYESVARQWSADRQESQDEARNRRLDKLISTYRYWARDYLDGDGRIRCRLDPLATESGRFSCASPNLQQVPNHYTAPGLRACFHPPPGHSLIMADYAQIELRVAAHIADCSALRQLFVQGQDPHRNTAATLRGCPVQEVSDEDRKLAKAINFGFLFGMGAARFRGYAEQSYGLQLSESQANQAKSAFLAAYPGIHAWQKRTAALGRNAGQAIIVKTALGRIKHFAAGAFRFNAALNIPVQGSAAEGFKQAMVRLHRELPPMGGMGVLCIHDEYIAQVPTQRATELSERIVSIMEQEMQKVITTVPIRANAVVAPAWT